MMLSTRPYLIRAFYEWIIDNKCTPHIVVNAETIGADVPRDYINGGQIVLNISTTAVQALALGNESISFQARFGGKARSVNIPLTAIMAIYARENGRGMVFTDEDNNEPSPEEMEATTKAPGAGKGQSSKSPGRPSHLTVVK